MRARNNKKLIHQAIFFRNPRAHFRFIEPHSRFLSSIHIEGERDFIKHIPLGALTAVSVLFITIVSVSAKGGVVEARTDLNL